MGLRRLSQLGEIKVQQEFEAANPPQDIQGVSGARRPPNKILLRS